MTRVYDERGVRRVEATDRYSGLTALFLGDDREIAIMAVGASAEQALVAERNRRFSR